jgi:hypothetical protein
MRAEKQVSAMPWRWLLYGTTGAVVPDFADGSARNRKLVMPGPVPGIHVLASLSKKDVDGRDRPGHDERRSQKKARLRGPFINDSVTISQP